MAAIKTTSKPPAGESSTNGDGSENGTSDVKGKLTGPRKIVLDTLERFGGVIEDPDGQATVKLFEAMGRDDITIKALQNSLGKMDARGLVVRDVRGKRTYSIGVPQAAPRSLATNVDGDHRGEQSRESAESRTPRRTALQARGDGRSDGADVGAGSIDYAELATALLNRVAEILAAGDPSQMADVLARLGDQTETTQRQARKLLELTEELIACRSERDDLRTRYAQLEANARAILKGDHAGNTRALRALEAFIAKPPTRRG